jgi:osmotically-inducible protein OsmY
MKNIKYLSALLLTVALLFTLGCASTATRESTGEFVDDSAITTKVKTAIFHEPTLKSSEINVVTYKGEVQLSGFVSSTTKIDKTVAITSNIAGVRAIKNNMQVK